VSNLTSTSGPAPHPGAGHRGNGAGNAQHPWRRFVAIGDSVTEGIGDPDPDNPGGHRGWADRTAEELARTAPDFAYANLAIRGRLLGQILAEQAEAALALRPDLVSVCAGGNDVLRPGSDPDVLAARLDELLGIVSRDGATVLLFTGFDVGHTPVLSAVRGKTAIYNENMRALATRHRAVVADLWASRDLRLPGMWTRDRIHFSPLGHHTVAALALEALGVPHTLEPLQARAALPRSWRTARHDDLVWARAHLAPWVLHWLRHQSDGDGITAKRPAAGPLRLPGAAGAPAAPGTAEPD